MNDSADTDEVEGFWDEMYVRVYGHLKFYQGKKQVVAFAIRHICDYNEIASHFLECVFMHSYNAKLANLTSSTAPAPANSAVSSNHSSGHQPAASTHSVEQYSLDGLKDMEKKIIDYLEQPSSLAHEKGVHRDEIAPQLKLPSDKILLVSCLCFFYSTYNFLQTCNGGFRSVSEAMQSLETEGLVYSTVDECHLKSTCS